jgi:chemotaxis protein MotB
MSGHGGHDDGGLPEEHEEHANHEAWVIPYADLLTLLMAMFIALFAMSTVDMSKFKQLAIGFNEALGGGKLDTNVFAGSKNNSVVPNDNNGGGSSGGGIAGDGASIASGQDANALQKLLQQIDQIQQKKASEGSTLSKVAADIKNKAKGLGLDGKIDLQQRDNGLLIRVVSDQVLFASGQADLQPEGQQVLALVGQAVRDLPNKLLIDGYTDNQAINSAQFHDNYWLSGARASTVLEFFAQSVGIDETRMVAQAHGDQDPIATNDTPEGRARNRRVEILVQSTAVDQVIKDNNLTGSSETTTTTVPVQPAAPSIAPDLHPIG